ncbi:MAG: ATP-binding protein [Sulfuricurvum sp.]|uniref:ATP-binding protein n=1 Tax=Sulfuricurvum sp. TaxID=2025608 RepID=UPI002621BF4A|nr:ATP-binding protein [Sulfuricurvum sp.]MDD2828432.1 ATP-binding protein [Sulfuricurvum sp.]MDD4949437.1 ATP-binding protein [Sulfuricurvum sp.]
MKLSNYPITRQFIVIFTSLSALILMIATIFALVLTLLNEKHRFIHESTLEAQFIADTVLSPLAFFDSKGAEEILKAVKNQHSVIQVSVYDSNHQLFSEINPLKRSEPASFNAENGFINNTWLTRDAEYRIILPIKHGKEVLGYLYLIKSASGIIESLNNLIIPLGIFSITLIIFVILVSHKLGDYMLHPILSLAQSANLVADKRDFSLRVTYEGKNEIARLYDAFNLMLSETQTLTEDLEKRVEVRTHQLQNSLDSLKQAQNQLIESEKMAALGNLVGGVAHEVNTPLGNAVTGSSIITRESAAIQKGLNEGTLTRSEMEKKLDVILQSSQLLFKSVTQAAELIKSFKQISIDQSTNDLRDFDLKEYLYEIVQTFHNKLKHIPIDVEIISPEHISIYSYPGVFAQLFNNLIANAILHAFEKDMENAKITITLELLENTIHLLFHDNGKGVNPSIKDKIFEPFVTTKRNAGGTGLGLSIVYNLVTQKLGGTISVHSEIPNGTTFEIHLPYLERKIV